MSPRARLLDPLRPKQHPDVTLTDRVAVEERTRRVWAQYCLRPNPAQTVVSNVSIHVTSASYVDTWVGRVPTLVGDALDLGFYLYLVTGVQATLRVQIDHPDGTYTSGAHTTAVGGDEFHAITAVWLHKAALWTMTGTVSVALQVRRDAGASGVVVYDPVRYIVRDPGNATSGPTWSDV